MKRLLLSFTATAGMLLLGGVSASAQTTLTLKASEGTFYSATGSASYYSQWTSATDPVITILDGENRSNMNPVNTDDFELHEGTGNLTHGFTVSVADGYVITGMTVTVTTAVDDMSVTVGTVSQTLTADEATEYTVSGLWRQAVGITVTSTGAVNEGATFSNWTVTVQEDADLSKMQIKSIGSAITTMPVEGTWYLIENNKGSGYTPAGDTGDGKDITRASSADAVQVGDYVMDVMQYMLGFYPTALVSSTGVGNVCNLQFATGNYWASAASISDGTAITATSSLASAGDYNVYPTATGGTTFGLNAYDMGKLVDNNGAGGAVVGWESGYNTATSGNNVWLLYPLELEQVEDEVAEEHEHEVVLEALIEEAQAAYDANQIYDTDIDFGFSSGNGVGNGIIQSTAQFSSPYTDPTEGSVDNLLDNDADEYWHSTWHNGDVENGVHYIQVDVSDTYLSGDNAFTGGPLLVNILRRNTNNDHVTKMSVKDGSDTWIADLDLPFGSAGERVVAGFTCPANVYTLRFYEEETYGTEGGMNRGYFHLGDFQLFYTTDTGSPNYGVQEAEDLAAAIATAQATLDVALAGSGSVSEADIQALQAALDAYNAYFGAQTELNEKLLEAIELAYDAYEANCGYEDLVLESAGDNLIKSADQLSSPYSETEDALGNLIDNDIETHWDSKWSSGSVDNGVHYIQVELPEDFDGGEIQVYIERRNNTYNNHITEMSVKGIVSDEYGREATYRIALLELPYASHYQEGEEEYAGFTCPAGVKTLRFYEEATAGENEYNAGFWHLSEFHLYESSLTDDCGNTTLKTVDKKNETLLAAISTALATYGICTEDDITALETAISTYLHEDISWTLGADYGTLILPFNDNVDTNGLTVYPCTAVSSTGDEVELTTTVNAIAPKTPYIVSGTAGSFTFSGDASFKTSLYTEGLLTGTLTGTTAPTNSYVLQLHEGEDKPAFYLVDGSSTITVGNYHAYLTLADESDDEGSGVKAAVISFPGSGTATAIEAVESEAEAGGDAIYDLSGRKVAKAQKGIYIVNGKKVVIK